ncbi:MAG: ABA4-like family protein [Aestuariivirgaceae bacterium]|nr:ABA4-like family protein [Aestuariivirgaceae bacterium]
MTAESTFTLVNYAALAGWIALIAGVVLKNERLADMIGGRLVPLGLAIFYTAIAPSFFTAPEGGFDSLANVQILFGDPWLVLGGWLHWMAADLFIGSWVARQVLDQGWSRWWLAGLLPLCFVVGPVGFLAYHALAIAQGGMRISNGGRA